MTVDQMAVRLLPGDGLSNDALAIQAHLGAAGIGSTLTDLSTAAQTTHKGTQPLLVHVREPNPALMVAAEHRGPLIIREHGAWWTPGRSLAFPGGQALWDAQEAQLAKLYRRAELVLATSTIAAERASRLGATSITVAPPLFPHDQFVAARKSEIVATADSAIQALSSAFVEAAPNILVVGRLDPHSGLDAVISVFHTFASRHSAAAQLTIVGRSEHAWLYSTLNETVGSYRLNCRLLGHVSQAELIKEFQRADALLVVPEASGFCVRAAEAMTAGVPVVARANPHSAIGETLAGAGLLLDETDGDDVLAEALHEVLANKDLNRELISAAKQRSDAFETKASFALILQTLRQFVDA